MKELCLIIGVAGIVCAAISFPAGIGFGLYDWAIAENEFAKAAWYGFKVWIVLLVGGLVIGLPAFFYGKD